MPQRQVEYSHRDVTRTDAARVLALMYLGGSVLLALSGWVSHAPNAPVGLYRSLTAVGLVCTAVLAWAAPRVRGWALQGLLALYSLLIALLAFVAVRELAVTTLGPAVIAIGMFAGYFLSFRAMAVQVTLALALWLLGALTGTTPVRLFDLLTTVFTTVGVAVLLHRLTRRLRRAGALDALTGVLVRSSWFSAAAATLRELGAATAAVVLIDLDDFKRVNDDDGHEAGDRLLQGAAASWNALAVQHRWVLGRYGGDEFVVLIPQGGRRAARQAVAELHAAHPVAWTAGIAVVDDRAHTVPQLVQRADADLLDNKRVRKRY